MIPLRVPWRNFTCYKTIGFTESVVKLLARSSYFLEWYAFLEFWSASQQRIKSESINGGFSIEFGMCGTVTKSSVRFKFVLSLRHSPRLDRWLFRFCKQKKNTYETVSRSCPHSITKSLRSTTWSCRFPFSLVRCLVESVSFELMACVCPVRKKIYGPIWAVRNLKS